MKKGMVIAQMVLLLSMAAYAQDFEWYKKLSKVQATIRFLEDKQTVVIVPLNNPREQRYISLQLPEEFKKEGLLVTFNGFEGKIPPNFRMLGTPLKLTAIWVSKEEQQKHKLQKRCYSFK